MLMLIIGKTNLIRVSRSLIKDMYTFQAITKVMVTQKKTVCDKVMIINYNIMMSYSNKENEEKKILTCYNFPSS